MNNCFFNVDKNWYYRRHFYSRDREIAKHFQVPQKRWYRKKGNRVYYPIRLARRLLHDFQFHWVLCQVDSLRFFCVPRNEMTPRPSTTWPWTRWMFDRNQRALSPRPNNTFSPSSFSVKFLYKNCEKKIVQNFFQSIKTIISQKLI